MKTTTTNIRLATISDVRDFVNAVAAFEDEIDLQSGRYVVDGKSIMGIFSLDLLSPILMTMHGEVREDLLTALKAFETEAPEA